MSEFDLPSTYPDDYIFPDEDDDPRVQAAIDARKLAELENEMDEEENQ